MTEANRSAVAFVIRALAGGVGFVWLMGFAIGYRSAGLPLGLFALAVGLLVASGLVERWQG